MHRVAEGLLPLTWPLNKRTRLQIEGREPLRYAMPNQSLQTITDLDACARLAKNKSPALERRVILTMVAHTGFEPVSMP